MNKTRTKRIVKIRGRNIPISRTKKGLVINNIKYSLSYDFGYEDALEEYFKMKGYRTDFTIKLDNNSFSFSYYVIFTEFMHEYVLTNIFTLINKFLPAKYQHIGLTGNKLRITFLVGNGIKEEVQIYIKDDLRRLPYLEIAKYVYTAGRTYVHTKRYELKGEINLTSSFTKYKKIIALK